MYRMGTLSTRLLTLLQRAEHYTLCLPEHWPTDPLPLIPPSADEDKPFVTCAGGQAIYGHRTTTMGIPTDSRRSRSEP